MATDLFREAPFGQLVRAITKNKVFAYPEEQPNFEGLEFYRGGSKSQSGKALADVVENKEETEAEVRIPDYARQQSTPMSSSEESLKEKQHLPSLALHPTERPPHVPERHDVERNLEVEKTTSKPILPLTTNDGTILVDWYYTDDPANPQNWSKKKKAFVALQIDLYTLVVYAGSAIYVSSQPAVVEAFGIGYLEAALGLATFLVYSFLYLPYSLGLWVSTAFAAPALGPLLSGFSVPAKNWRWSSWEILWMSAPVFILWFICLPETSTPNILYRRAARLRKLVGVEIIRSQTEIDRKGITAKNIAFNAVIKPVEIMMKDPAVLFTNVYTGLNYGIYYSFLESFPLVYPIEYGFNLGLTTVVFTSLVIGCVFGILIYFSYLQFVLIPDIMKNGPRTQEWRLRPALIFTFGLPIGLFLFAWTANSNVHWIVSVIGITIFAATVYVVLQCIFLYIPMSYPQYAASLFAGNDTRGWETEVVAPQKLETKCVA